MSVAEVELAMKVLNSRALDDDTKVALLGSLRLTRESVTAAALEAHAHSVDSRAGRGGSIADDQDAFHALGENEGPVKLALIRASKTFMGYMTSLTLTANDVRDLASPATPNEVKEVLFREYATFAPNSARMAQRPLLRGSRQTGTSRSTQVPGQPRD